MNKSELGSKISDMFFGKRIEGTVAAILPSSRLNSSRYVIDTGNELLDVHVPMIENHGIFISQTSYTFNPPLNRNDHINAKVINAKAWVDGQRV